VSEFKKSEIAHAFCRSSNLKGPEADAISTSLQSMLNHGVLRGKRPAGAGKTAALRYTIGDACFAAVILELKRYSFSHEVAKGLRPGFSEPWLSAALELIREGKPVNLTLQFGQVARKPTEKIAPFVWCALHPKGLEPNWTPYLPDTRPRPAIHNVSFTAEWLVSDLLRPFLFCLEEEE
jgi:hypothetical protein